MNRLNDNDFNLSMAISKRGKPETEIGLRSLLVHRLRPGLKAILRYALRSQDSLKKKERWSEFGVYCEPCQQWFKVSDEEWGEDVECPHCQRVYWLEFCVYSEAPYEEASP